MCVAQSTFLSLAGLISAHSPMYPVSLLPICSPFKSMSTFSRRPQKLDLLLTQSRNHRKQVRRVARCGDGPGTRHSGLGYFGVHKIRLNGTSMSHLLLTSYSPLCTYCRVSASVFWRAGGTSTAVSHVAAAMGDHKLQHFRVHGLQRYPPGIQPSREVYLPGHLHGRRG